MQRGGSTVTLRNTAKQQLNMEGEAANTELLFYVEKAHLPKELSIEPTDQ